MLNTIPHFAWLRVVHYLDLHDSCLLREVSHALKKRFDTSVKQIYSKMEGTIDYKMSYFCDGKFIRKRNERSCKTCHKRSFRIKFFK